STVLYDSRRPAAGGTGAPSARPAGMDRVLQNGRVHLGLCLQQALHYNLDVAVARLDADAARSRINLAKAEFDPELGGTVANFPDGGGDTSFNGVAHKKFVTGTDIRAEVGTVAFDNTDRTQGIVSKQADVAVRLRQPLLKGANPN